MQTPASSLPFFRIHGPVPYGLGPSTWPHHLYRCHIPPPKPSLGSLRPLTCHQSSPGPRVKGLQI